jgi:hypothetical protein
MDLKCGEFVHLGRDLDVERGKEAGDSLLLRWLSTTLADFKRPGIPKSVFL